MSRLSLQAHAPPAGLGNPLVAAAELGGALLLALLALALPLLGLALAVMLVLAAWRLARRLAFGRPAAAPEGAAAP